MNGLRLYLASASPRRLALLRQVGLEPTPRPPHVPEEALVGEAPDALVRRLAEVKARKIAAGLGGEEGAALVLAADTAVVLDGEALGKPAGPEEALAMLRRLRGRSHEVLTGVFLLRGDDGRHAGGVESTRVQFRDYDDATVEAYVDSREPMDKAGAYGIQGRGIWLAERLEGSWSNVVGLPLERLPGWFAEVGVGLSGLIRWDRRD